MSIAGAARRYLPRAIPDRTIHYDILIVVLTSPLCFCFFCYDVFIVLRYKKLHAALAMAKTKPINHSQPPASPLHGINQTPQIHRKSPPRLALKIKTLDT